MIVLIYLNYSHFPSDDFLFLLVFFFFGARELLIHGIYDEEIGSFFSLSPSRTSISPSNISI